jgi:hypothetical protein
MAITKMSIGVPPVNLFTGAATALRQSGGTSDGSSVLATHLEVEMRTTEIAADFGALTDTDLDLVEGAAACSPCGGPSNNTKGAGGASGIAPPNAAAMAAWNDLLRQNGF